MIVTTEGLNVGVLKKGSYVKIYQGGKVIQSVGPGEYDPSPVVVYNQQKVSGTGGEWSEARLTYTIESNGNYLISMFSGGAGIGWGRREMSLTINGAAVGTEAYSGDANIKSFTGIRQLNTGNTITAFSKAGSPPEGVHNEGAMVFITVYRM